MFVFQERAVYLAACLARDGIRNKDDKFDFRYFIGNTKVCTAFFQTALDVSNHTMVGTRKRVLDNDTLPPVHGNTTSRHFGIKKQYLCAYLERLFQEKGNHNPERLQLIMPQELSKESIYVDYLASLTPEQEVDRKIIAGYFYAVWRKEYPTVICAKYHAFSRCDVCANIRLQKKHADKAGQGIYTATKYFLMILRTFVIQRCVHVSRNFKKTAKTIWFSLSLLLIVHIVNVRRSVQCLISLYHCYSKTGRVVSETPGASSRCSQEVLQAQREGTDEP